MVSVLEAKRPTPRVLALLAGKIAYRDARNEMNDTILHFAVHNNLTDVVALLLSNKVNVNALNQHNESALLWAVTYARSDSVFLLLEHNGVDVNSKNVDGITPLHEVMFFNLFFVLSLQIYNSIFLILCCH